MCDAEFRSEVKCVNKSEEGGERVRVESVFSLSLSESGGSREGKHTQKNHTAFPRSRALAFC